MIFISPKMFQMIFQTFAGQLALTAKKYYEIPQNYLRPLKMVFLEPKIFSVKVKLLFSVCR